MKTIETYPGTGSLAIGTKEAWAELANRYGDETTRTLIFDSWEEFEQFGGRGWRFQTLIEGTRIEIVRPGRDGILSEWRPVAELSGAYSCYDNDEGTVAIVRRGDACML